MNVTAKEAYRLALNEIGEMQIYSCTELSDRFLFGWVLPDGTPTMLPPLCVYKSTGEVDLHDETGVQFLNGTCREQGTPIPLEELQ